MREICDNAIDDDNDGLIDLNDPNCRCEMVSLASLIPNPSFEDYRCCPDDASQLSCADAWNQASTGTTDYINTCGYLTAGESMLPFPDGEGAILFLSGTVDNGSGREIYREYAGGCLNMPMKKDSIYKFKFHIGFINKGESPGINFTFFGSPSCSNLPFTQLVDCPTNYPDWYALQSQFISGDSDSPTWVEVEVEIQPPVDINALVIGGDCVLSPNIDLGIYFLDNLRLNDKSNFDFELLDKGTLCDPDYTFAVAYTSGFLYQWYKEGIALLGETNSELSQMYGEGYYQLRMVNINTQECRIADDYEFTIPVYEYEIYKSICEGESFLYNGDVIETKGIYDYTFTAIDGCDSVVFLNLTVQPNRVDTVYAQTLLGTSYTVGDYQIKKEGEHIINIATTEGCDSMVVLYLENIKVFIPNIFSPNGDSNNDYFEVFSSDDAITTTEMSIYDRWGGLVYRGDRWDGTYENEYLNPGVYFYLVRLINMDGEDLSFRGSVTLVR
ncbi:MAG: hypothetical protein Sapg2KO_21260 [Saprospiraceae bacterium]